MRGRILSVAVAAAVLAVSAVAPALAGSGKVKHFETTVTIKTNQDAGRIFGKVKSDKAKCVSKRKVILNVDGEDVFNGRADDDGNYGIHTTDGSSLGPGKYEVHSPKLNVSNKVVCDPGNSKIVTLH
jgi:hypothetical protein